jgi:predicted ATPase
MIGIPSAGEYVGRWCVQGELGRGGMAVVLDVIDEANGETAALKLMLPGAPNEEITRRFRREFRALHRLDHPNVLHVFETGTYDDRPYFVMERVGGQCLRDQVEEWRELAPAERFRRAESVLIQVARALEYVHAHGLVHRDVTPANVMLEPDGRARLMDFGVVKEPGCELTSVGEVVGTVAYIAPEQIQGGKVDARADLYSLGAVLYLMLTGRRPFNARTLAGYMEKHLHRPVRPPRELTPTVPPELDEICVRLLAKDPADRFASATHLLHALGAAGDEGPPLGHPAWAPPLVGRTAELAQIHEAIARVTGQGAEEEPGRDRRAGGLLIIEGNPGTGGARLTDELAAEARTQGTPLSRSHNQTPTQLAFSGYRPLYEDLVRGGVAQPALLLQGVFGAPGAIPKPERAERWAVMAAMAELIREGGPRVIILEALDRADRGTVELTEYLVRNLVGIGGAPLLFAITRQEPADFDPLRGLVSGESTGVIPERIVLGPLSPSATEELVLHVVADGAAARALAKRLHKEGEGSPFFIVEMLRALHQEGVIGPRPVRGPAELTVDEDEVDHLTLPVPSSLKAAIVERLLPLRAEARQVAEVLAISRQELDLTSLMTITHLSEEEALTAIDALLAAELALERVVGSTECYELARNRVRDVLVAEMAPALRADLHRRVGSHLERQFRHNPTAIVETLAWHFEQGDRPAKAYPYLVRAAEKLATRTFVAEALACLDRAQGIEPEAREYLTLDDADRRLAELKLQRAQALVHLGAWAEGEAEAQAAHALAVELQDERVQTRTFTELALLARRLRRLDEAEGLLRKAIALAEGIGDKRLQVVPLYELGAVQWARGDLEAARDFFVQALASAEAYQEERSLALGYNGLGLVALCKGQSAEARRYFEQAIEVSEKHGLMDRLTVARTNLAEVFHLTGNIRKGLELADHAITHAREVDHLYGMGLGLRYRAMLLTDLGRLPEAIENAEEAVRIQRQLDNPEDTLTALVMLLRAVLSAGEVDRALQLMDEAAPLLAAFDSEGFAPLVHAWRARIAAATGNPVGAREALARATAAIGRSWPYQQCRLLLNLSRVHALLGEPSVALSQAEEALRLADASGYRLYAMRARLAAAQLSPDEASAARHARVADALVKSLAANLPREDAELFISTHSPAPRD